MKGAARLLAIAAAIAAAGPGATPAPANAQAPPAAAQLTPDSGQETRTLDLGGSRDPTIVTIRFVAPTKLPSKPDPDLSDPQTSEGRTLDATLTPAVSLKQGDRTVVVTVKVTPSESAKAGNYDAQLLLRAAGVTDARSKLTIKLGDKPVPGAGALATLLLVVGAAIGLIAKFIAGKASTLKGLEDRLASVEALVAGHEPLPVVFRTKHVQAHAQLARDLTGDADSTLKNDLEGAKTAAALDVADKARAIERKVTEQRGAIAVLPDLDADARGKLEQVLVVECDWIEAMVQAADYDSDAQRTERVGSVNDARRFSAFLIYYRDKERRAGFAEALEAFVAGDFADAETKWRAAAGATDGQALGALPAQPQPTIAAVGGRSDLTGWLIRHAPLLSQVFTALGLVILGLFTVYDPSKTFRGDGEFLDAVRLFAWGLGSALAGGGISDITGKLTAGRSGST